MSVYLAYFVFIVLCYFLGNYILTQSTVPGNITTVNEGDNVTIVCKVSGNGIKRVEWYKDKIELYSRYNNTEDFNVSVAHLTAVTVSQAGEYECRTSIVRRPYVGYQAESVTLQVIGKRDCCSAEEICKVNISNCLPQYGKKLLTLMNIIGKGLWTMFGIYLPDVLISIAWHQKPGNPGHSTQQLTLNLKCERNIVVL